TLAAIDATDRVSVTDAPVEHDAAAPIACDLALVLPLAGAVTGTTCVQQDPPGTACSAGWPAAFRRFDVPPHTEYTVEPTAGLIVTALGTCHPTGDSCSGPGGAGFTGVNDGATTLTWWIAVMNPNGTCGPYTLTVRRIR
ncbi:MAG: hypothetical protein WCJ30_07155, partial [Deltaproteobacteria bacterium]